MIASQCLQVKFIRSYVESLKKLQNNVDHFFQQNALKHSEHMACKQGCFECCKVDLNIFSTEANFIEESIALLSKEEKEVVLDSLKKNSLSGYCPFLIEQSCAIYNFRPIICRSQGLPLYVESEDRIDACPLNFKLGYPDKKDWLNLERLATLQSLVEIKNGTSHTRVNMLELKKKLVRDIEKDLSLPIG